jgi:uncharacterized protein
VLIKPTLSVEESSDAPEQVAKQRSDLALKEFNRKELQSTSNAAFSMAETFGLSYAVKMLKSSFGFAKPNIDLTFGHSVSGLNCTTIDLQTKTTLAFNALSGMGLTSNFAKYVFFFGHGGETSNNPYEGALECGACAGHNGGVNAILLANLLNDPAVRQNLKLKDLDIPDDTLFLSGWHNTTRDLLTLHTQEKFLTAEFEVLKNAMDQASEKCRLERAAHLLPLKNLSKSQITEEIFARAMDWSEIRSEWALAKNHSFIVAKRCWTRALDLEGRSFLHDYDKTQDPDLKKLELIMTAPMIVTNWINMQYYCSTIDPQKFGTGNKTLNNVTCTIGCIQGNEGDLLGGLSEQSVRRHGDYFHEPLRLQVFIEADPASIDAIIERHPMVADLVFNEWLHIVSMDVPSSIFKLRLKNTWKDL